MRGRPYVCAGRRGGPRRGLLPGDAETANHSFVAHYRDADHVAERLVAIAAEARERIAQLSRRRRHAIILTAVCAYYVSSRDVLEGFPAPAAEQLVASAGPAGALIRAMVRARRHLHARAGTSGERAKTAGAAGAPTPAERASLARARR